SRWRDRALCRDWSGRPSGRRSQLVISYSRAFPLLGVWPAWFGLRGELATQHCEHVNFLRREVAVRFRTPATGTVGWHFKQRAVQIGGDRRRVDVAAAADGASVAEAFGHPIDHRDHV